MICDYGNCQTEVGDSALTVTVRVRSNQTGDAVAPKFCCRTHAALWLLRQAKHDRLENTAEIAQLLKAAEEAA